MGVIMKKFLYKITDPLGIHARPAGLLVKEASSFESSVKIIRGEKEVDAKKIFGVMGLAVKYDEDIEIVADGPDEDAAVARLEEFIKINL